MKSFTFWVLSCLILCSCTSTPLISSKLLLERETLYLDHRFNGFSAIDIESEGDIFSIDDKMKEMVRTELSSEETSYKRAKKLLLHLFDQNNINLSYDNLANLTATQSYYSKKANCLSLTIMAYSLAKEAGLNVVFQDVEVPEYWVRNNEFNMLTGHINLLVKPSGNNNSSLIWRSNSLQIDFDPFIQKKQFPAKVIDKNTIMAMFYTNIGAQAIVDEDFIKAYAYLKQATKVSPTFASSWSNLGVLYRMVGDFNLADKTYRYALALSPENLSTLNNLAVLMHKMGDVEEAVILEKLLHKKRLNNPYYHALLADEAYYRQDYNRAKLHYKNAIKLNGSLHELYFGLAKVYYQVKEFERAEFALTKAIKLNNNKEKDNQYIAKLNWLKDDENTVLHSIHQ